MKRLAIICCWLGLTAPTLAEDFVLSETCPPSFHLLENGTCELVSLYIFYDTPPGHGGFRAKLEPPASTYTPQQIDLGRYLFFDPILSGSGELSCASCHSPSHSLADGRATSLGTMALKRSAPSLWNAGFNNRFMWDGRADTLEEQALLPIFNPAEMNNSAEGVLADLNASESYTALFETAFGGAPSLDTLASALAAFETSLVSLNSRYDRYVHGDDTALSAQELSGMNAFRGFVGRCSQCHIPPLFTNNELVVVGSPPDAQGVFDLGAGELSDETFLQGAFKVPTLRNISKTAPYFHAGQFATLEEVGNFYNDTRGHALAEGTKREIHWHIHMTDGPKLSKANVADIVAFLASLTDETMMAVVPTAVPSGRTVVGGTEPRSN